MKTETTDLKTIAMVINEPGFKLIEGVIQKKFTDNDTLSRVTGNLFNDGKQVGKVEAIGEIVYMINELRKKAKEIGDRDD